MAIKQSTGKKTTKSAVEKPAATVSPARVTKPRTPRVTAATHSKTTATEPIKLLEVSLAAVAVAAVATAVATEDPREAIAKIAYSYWEARGYQGGDPAQDWLRAEAEYARHAA